MVEDPKDIQDLKPPDKKGDFIRLDGSKRDVELLVQIMTLEERWAFRISLANHLETWGRRIAVGIGFPALGYFMEEAWFPTIKIPTFGNPDLDKLALGGAALAALAATAHVAGYLWGSRIHHRIMSLLD